MIKIKKEKNRINQKKKEKNRKKQKKTHNIYLKTKYKEKQLNFV